VRSIKIITDLNKKSKELFRTQYLHEVDLNSLDPRLCYFTKLRPRHCCGSLHFFPRNMWRQIPVSLLFIQRLSLINYFPASSRRILLRNCLTKWWLLCYVSPELASRCHGVPRFILVRTLSTKQNVNGRVMT